MPSHSIFDPSILPGLVLSADRGASHRMAAVAHCATSSAMIGFGCNLWPRFGSPQRCPGSYTRNLPLGPARTAPASAPRTTEPKTA